MSSRLDQSIGSRLPAEYEKSYQHRSCVCIALLLHTLTKIPRTKHACIVSCKCSWTIISEPDGPKQPTRVCEMLGCLMPYRGLIRAMRPRVHIDQSTGKKLRPPDTTPRKTTESVMA